MNSVLVLLSTYNGEKFLACQLDSLMLQENVRVSVLARDDGSTDKTVWLLNQYKNKMDIRIIEGENVGSTRSFLSLVHLCDNSYDYYAFCDQDDFWESDKLIDSVDKLSNYESNKPALFYSGQILVDENMNFICAHDIDSARNVIANCIFNQMAGCTAVFNLELLKKMKCHIDSGIIPIFHDSCIYKICAMYNGNIYCQSKGKIKYRQHGNNVVGLDYSIKGKIRKVFSYMRPSELLGDLRYIFENCNDIEKNSISEFLEYVFSSNEQVSSKIWLLFNQGKVKFNSVVLRSIFMYKILFSKF